MAKQIIWTPTAQNDQFDIFDYWNNRNKSNLYSKKLNKLFQEHLAIISKHPEIGVKLRADVYRKTVRDYQLIYLNRPKEIVLLAIWDTRQRPDKLYDKLKES